MRVWNMQCAICKESYSAAKAAGVAESALNLTLEIEGFF